MDSEDGELFIKSLAAFVRTHEKALANALQFKRQSVSRHGSSQSVSSAVIPSSPTVTERPSTASSTSSALASALSFGTLNFTSHSVKSAKLALTPHHLFYMLSRFEELGIPVGPMKVRLENLHDSTTSANYVSFLSQSQRAKTRGHDASSIHSVSSIRSVMSGMSALWASFGLGSGISAARTERQKAATQADLKYLYSAFTKIPCLRLSPDYRARLIRGYEEFPFDSAVPLHVFKNVQALEVSHLDFRQFFGWDRLADQLRSLSLKHASVDDPADVLIDIVLDDMDKRRRRTSKAHNSPTTAWLLSQSPRRSPTMPHAELHKSVSAPGSPDPRTSVGELRVGSVNTSDTAVDPDEGAGQEHRRPSLVRADTDEPKSPTKSSNRPRSHSPSRPTSSRNASSHHRSSHKVRRSGSGSSHSSLSDSWHNPRASASNLLAMGILPASKWRFLRHLSLADNGLTGIAASSLSPLANTLHSLDLSSNLFTQIPDSLATLTALRALNLSHCMIDSLHSLTRNPLPAITALNLRANRLQSIAGIEKLYPLERLDLRENRLTDPMELARLTGIPDIREVWVEGNPFVRTHRDYRITIFNLFRNMPGYTEDVVIDGFGPSYTEKKYLVERAPVPAAVPVVRPPVPEIPAVDVSKPAIIYDAPREPAVLRKERPAPKATLSEVNTNSTRRRRAPRRRIVDLATSEAAANTRPLGISDSGVLARDVVATVAASSDSHYRISRAPESQQLPVIVTSEGRAKSAESPSDVPRVDTAAMRARLSPGRETQEEEEQDDWKELPGWDTNGELYRQKIEALRDKVGDGYLSVLSEEGWGSAHGGVYPKSSLEPSPTILPATAAPRAISAQSIHSGRTIG